MVEPKVTSSKGDRGRPPLVRPSETYGRAENYRGILDQVWDRLWPALSQARSEDEVTTAFSEHARPYDRQFVPAQAALTLQVLREPMFPKRRKSQVGFLADSLAALGVVSPRRSRDICAQERAKAKRAHHIIRCEFYVECSCGFKGPSRDRACRRCGAEIMFYPFGMTSSF